MANELNIALAKSGLTVTAQPYQAGAAVGSAISCPETGSTGFYSGNMTGTAGTYQVAFLAAGANVGSGSIVWDGTAEIPFSTLTTGDLPSVPSAASVATAVRTELTEISNLDASISSRLASASYTAPANSDITAIKSKTDNLPASPAAVSDIPTTAQISSAVEGSLLDENDGQAVLNALVGAIGNQNVDEIALVAAIRSDLERTGGKLDSIPTDAAPSAASVASAVWSASTKEITGGVVDTLTNSPDVPTEAEIATAVWGAATKEITGGTVDTLTNAPSVPSAASIRAEIDSNSTQLAAIKAKTDLLPASPAATGDIPTADITAIKGKTDLLNTDRLGQCSTVATTGAQLAAALS